MNKKNKTFEGLSSFTVPLPPRLTKVRDRRSMPIDIFRDITRDKTRDIFRTLVYSEAEAYSESCQISALEHFVNIVNGYNYFPKF